MSRHRSDLPGKGRKLDVELLRSSWLGDDVAMDGGEAPIRMADGAGLSGSSANSTYAPPGPRDPDARPVTCARHGFALAKQPVFRGKAVQEATLFREPGDPCQRRSPAPPGSAIRSMLSAPKYAQHEPRKRPL